MVPILRALRADLVPAELRGGSGDEIGAAWPDWAARRDDAIRARVAQGDDDSLIYFLLFGTSFTRERRVSERELAALALQQHEALAPLRQRVTDFVAASASPGDDERLQFVRQVFMRRTIDPSTDEGRARARRFLEEQAARVAGAGLARASTVLDPSAAAVEAQTVFRDRGLSSDTAVFIDYGIDTTLAQIGTTGLIPPASVRRVAIVGPGLDFADKLEGYDFYPQQTIQPFATIDSLRRHGLGSTDLRLTAVDVSARVNRHLDAARGRARAGNGYPIVLTRNTSRPWTAGLVEYWRRAGDRVGEPSAAPAPPPNAGPVDVRRVLVSPPVVLSTMPHDVNVVLDRLDVSTGEAFDLIVATNILLYYDVFEQALAVSNLARMLRRGGLLLTNTRVFELPPIPLREVGATDVTYMTLPGIGATGDRIVWYQRQ